MKNFLQTAEREALRAQHKKERDKRICDRIKAVLLSDEGWSHEEIAHVLLLSDEAIRQHILEYQESQKLKPENGGSSSKLNKEQTEVLVKHLQERTYLYTKEIVAYIEATFSIKYTIAGIASWLKSNEFSYKKPAVVPGKANREAQERWVKDYEEMKRTLPENERVCFIDGVHPTHNAKPAYGWIKKGERKEIPTNTGRQRLNLSGAIDIQSKQVIYQEDDMLNATSTIEFFKNIERQYSTEIAKVHIYCDNAKYFKNKEVRSYLTTSRIELHFLPTYSPNLNPIERLWKLMNEQILYNRYYEKFCDFKVAVKGFLDSLADPPLDLLVKLKQRITEKFHIFGKSYANSSA